MREFNLELAKMGAPVVTRNGIPVQIIDSKNTETHHVIVGWVGDVVITWYGNGRHRLHMESDLDIFIDAKEEYYINIYKDDEGLWASEHVYSTYEEAVKMGEDTPYFYATSKIQL